MIDVRYINEKHICNHLNMNEELFISFRSLSASKKRDTRTMRGERAQNTSQVPLPLGRFIVIFPSDDLSPIPTLHSASIYLNFLTTLAVCVTLAVHTSSLTSISRPPHTLWIIDYPRPTARLRDLFTSYYNVTCSITFLQRYIYFFFFPFFSRLIFICPSVSCMGFIKRWPISADAYTVSSRLYLHYSIQKNTMSLNVLELLVI